MAEIKGFKALRYTEKAGKIGELVCPPYDIISEEERKNFLATNKNNVIRLELPKDGEDPYKTAGDTLRAWIKDGILKQDDEDSIYIYEEEFDALGMHKKFKGFISLVKIEEFSKGVILPHEETLSKAKKDRFNLYKATDCNFSQIYSLYKDDDKSRESVESVLDRLSSCNPDVEITDKDAVTHRVWKVSNAKDVELISSLMADKKLYIADGHHRYETSLNFRNHLRENGQAGGNSDYVMMMLVAMENKGLVVFPTHRILKNLDNFNAEEAMAKCSDFFDIINYDNTDNMESELTSLYNQNKKAFAFYKGNGKYSLMVLKDLSVMDEMLPDKSKALKQLDVSILHTLVLERLFGIDKENMANQINLKYTRVLKEAIDEVDNGNGNCSFILNPTRVSEISDVATAGEKMPQKSTYFYPKLITGLVMNKIK